MMMEAMGELSITDDDTLHFLIKDNHNFIIFAYQAP